jgi:hypothetical protein
LKPKSLSPPEINSVKDWRDLQRVMAEGIFRPLSAGEKIQTRWSDGRKASVVAAEFIKPNSALSSLERLEIYNRQYWFRVLDCFYEDYPGLQALLGERAFAKLAQAYLAKHPSTSFSLRNLGSKLEMFLREEPAWAGKKQPMALDVAQFEWAQVVAFDGEARPPITVEELQAADPQRLKLRLQPYITLLRLDYAVDEFLLKLKKRDALRGEASHAMDAAPKPKSKRTSQPRLEKVFVAVHRQECSLYYKRLEPGAFALLTLLGKGYTIERACARLLRTDISVENYQNNVRDWFGNWARLGWFWCSK